MAVLDLGRAARQDLDALIDAGSERFGFDAAEAYVLRLTAALKRLEAYPESAPMVPDRTDGLRKLTVGSHVALYRVEGDVVRVIRILHQRMDPARHL
ncbi:type II toxin-antitoxin system RelE/ParE family toxin [Sandarakinorhabdus sp.]|uniref:type II toxin-antitoxin system RelE/ParE family toxin n=1 Tax=Sandarakinorhabdus sp. TaxID=1916663 RepID=UPI003F712649